MPKLGALGASTRQQVSTESGSKLNAKGCRPAPAPFRAVGTQAMKRQMGRAQSIGALRSADRGRKANGVRRARMQSARTANSSARGAGREEKGKGRREGDENTKA